MFTETDAYFSAATPKPLQFALIGEGLVLLGAIDLLKKRGHEISVVFLDSPGQEILLEQQGILVHQAPRIPAEVLSARPMDVLISINNRHIINKTLIQHPRLMALNYHNSLLPAYAGLRGTAWAIHNREKQHGITWHRISEGIDTGEILVQRVIQIEEYETAASLNEKCTISTLDGFAELLAGLEKYGSALPSIKQDLSRRSYYGRKMVLPRGGFIDWNTDAATISAFVSSTDWGPSYNDFGIASILLPSGESLPIREARVLNDQTDLPPGTLLGREAHEFTMSTAHGVVRLRPHPYPLIALPQIGSVLPSLTDEQVAWITDHYTDALLGESVWFPILKQVADRKQERIPTFDEEYGKFQSKTNAKISPAEAPAFFLDIIKNLLGPGSLVAVEASQPTDLFSSSSLFVRWLPLILVREGSGKTLLLDLEERPVLLRDTCWRHPQLAKLAAWETRQRVFLLRENTTMDSSFLPDGSVAFHASISGEMTLHFRGSEGRSLAQVIQSRLVNPTNVAGGHQKNNSQNPPNENNVLNLFRNQVVARPRAPAVQELGGLITYEELDGHSNRAANYLLAEGLQSEDIVVLLLPCSTEFVVAALGVLKAGGSYLPLDVEAPLKRLEFQLSDCGTGFVVTTSAYRSLLGDWQGKVLVLDEPAIQDTHAGPTDHDISLTSRAYLIYTSGSTGQPKAVEIEHRSLGNLIAFYHQRLALTERDRMTMLAHVTFDASVADLWPCLCAGGTVLIPPENILLDVDGLMAWLGDERVTYAFVPTAIAEFVLQKSCPVPLALRSLITGGDVLRVRPRPDLPFPVINTYGPTENTVDSVWSEVSSDENGRLPAIGRPITNVLAYVLDDNLRPVVEGEIGQLYLGGAQVARGYLHRLELTNQRFSADPFARIPGARMYCTGDRVRWNSDGELEFLGRTDLQVQIYGYRVELEEINTVLAAHALVKQVYCMEIRRDDLVIGIVAHVVPEATSDNLAEVLRNYLALLLPVYMIPRSFVFHAALPRNAAGKVDRSLLLERQPEITTPDIIPMESVTDLRCALQKLWFGLLPLAGPDTDSQTFWDLDGDSLTAVQLILGVHELTGRSLTVSNFLSDPTLPGLYRAVEAFFTSSTPGIHAETTRQTSVLIPIQTSGDKKPIYCIGGKGGTPINFRHLLIYLADDQPVYFLRARGFAPGEIIETSIEAIAYDYLMEVKRNQPVGPYHFLGSSSGGLIAYEMAQQLLSQGEDAAFVGLLDTLLADMASEKMAPLVYFLMLFRKHLQTLTSGGIRGVAGYLGYYRELWQFKIAELRDENKRKLVFTKFGDIADIYTRVEQVNTDASLAYKPKPYPGRVVMFSAARQVQLEGSTSDHGWSKVGIGNLVIYSLDCYHGNILFEPFVQQVVEKLNQHLYATEGRS